MMMREREPAWPRDVKWLSGGLLALTMVAWLAVLGAFGASEQARAVPVLTEALRATVLPGEGATPLEVREALGYEAGDALPVLPDLDVHVDATELASFSPDEALTRAAAVWTTRYLGEGREAVLAGVAAGPTREQLVRTLDGAAARLLEVALQSTLLPAGLADGSRMANWPLQAQQAPGEPVQPYVGVFVTQDAAVLQELDARQIAERVVAGLAEAIRAGGADAARELLANATLEARFEAGLEAARADLQDLFEALLWSRRPEVTERLEEALAVSSQDEAGEGPGLAGLLPDTVPPDATPEEANERVLAALAQRAWEGGAAAVAPILEPSGRAERLEAARPLVDALSAPRRGAYLRWAVIWGVLAAALAAVLVASSRGWARLANPGWAVLLPAGVVALVAWRARSAAAGGEAPLPPGLPRVGAFAHAEALGTYLVGRLPAATLDPWLWDGLIAAGVGGALVVLALLGWLTRRVRPRRRAYL